MKLLEKIKMPQNLKALPAKFKGLSKKKKIISIVAVVLIIALLATLLFGGKGKKTQERTYIEVQAAKGNIVQTIEQSGVVEPYERYEITSLVKGEILSSPFEEGDLVNEGDTLYLIDDEDAQLQMEKAQMSLDEANDNVAKLNIYATASGRLTDFSLKKGNNVGNGVIGRIVNTDTLTVNIPFSSLSFEKIEVGDKVTVTSSLYMTSLEGRVSHKYYANVDTSFDGSLLKNVEIEISNPGALASNTSFAATVHTKYGNIESSGSGTVGSGTITDVRAEVSGTVSYIAVKDGDYVKEGQLIATLKNSSVLNNQKNSELSLKSNKKNLDQYNIKSPITGTVITKNSKAGDKMDNSNSQKAMMVVADMSKMKFTITVDELDIADIKIGQTAMVDADAIPDATFEARVTSIASEGVSSGDGVTTFTIELTIDEPGELKSGMNVNANIVIKEAYDVVTIPEEALMSVRGNMATVLVKSSGKKTQKADDAANKGGEKNTERSFDKNSMPTGERPFGQNMPSGENKNQERPAANGEMPKAGSNGAPNLDRSKMPDAANGEENKNVEPNMNKGTEANAEKAANKNAAAAPNPNANQNSKQGSNSFAQGQNMKKPSGLPDGYEIRQIVVGVSNGSRIEVISGLSEGETVAYMPVSSSSTGFGMNGMMGGSRMMGGMMMGGGSRMMGGGMSGSRSQGSYNRSGSSNNRSSNNR